MCAVPDRSAFGHAFARHGDVRVAAQCNEHDGRSAELRFCDRREDAGVFHLHSAAWLFMGMLLDVGLSACGI